jgi:cytochrome c
MGRETRLLAAVLIGLILPPPALAGMGDPEQGRHLFRVCRGCHSLTPGKHRLGPSLAGIFGRKVGTAESFRYYSPALRRSNVVWNEITLDAWIAAPQSFIPGSRTTFPGLPDAQARVDLIAYLARAEYQDAALAPRHASTILADNSKAERGEGAR